MISELSIEITNKCLNRCLFCSGNCGPENNEFLNIEYIKSIFDQCKELGISSVCISGGEPFLHKDIVEICKMHMEDVT